MVSGDLYVLQKVPIQAYPPRIYLNGFPKSGLHLLELFAQELMSPSNVGRGASEWLGSFSWNSWSNQTLNLPNVVWRLSMLQRGNYLKGHMGHFDVVESVMYWGNIGQILIVRDLRDVAVSLAYHIMSDDPILLHQHKSVYGMLGGFNEILSAVIKGMGPYPGLFERWEKYAPWLDKDWVMKVTFEDLINEPETYAKSILKYCLYNATRLLEERHGEIVPTEETEHELIKRMVKRSRETFRSTTFRKGISGEWRSLFNEQHVDLFKKCDKNGWLAKLEYEEDDNWTI